MLTVDELLAYIETNLEEDAIHDYDGVFICEGDDVMKVSAICHTDRQLILAYEKCDIEKLFPNKDVEIQTC